MTGEAAGQKSIESENNAFAIPRKHKKPSSPTSSDDSSSSQKRKIDVEFESSHVARSTERKLGSSKIHKRSSESPQKKQGEATTLKQL